MTILSFDTFAGEIPRLPADRLPKGNAQMARNVNFAHGELRPIAALGTAWLAHATARPCRAAFTDNGLRWFAWDKPTRAFLAPTIDDTANRVYYQTHGEGLRVAQTGTMRLSSLEPRPPTESWTVGVKRPVGLTALPQSAPFEGLGNAISGAAKVTVVYVAVAINIWGEESAPSEPVTVEIVPGQTVALSIGHTADATQVALAGIAFYRTYEATPDYFLLNPSPTAPSGTVYSFSDASTTPPTTTTLTSAEWDAPPAAAGNLTYVGNGFFCVSAGKDLVMSEPYRPHAWPYRMVFPHGIIGIVPVEGGALVTTQAQTYMIYGAHPSQVSQQLLPTEQAGWSDTSMTRVGGTAVYASNDGLVTINGGQPTLESSQLLFTRKDWRTRYSNARLNLRLGQHDGRLIGFVDPDYPLSVTGDAFVIRLDEAQGEYCTLNVGQPIYGLTVSSTTDELYVCTATGAAVFAGSASGLTAVWHSADARFPKPVCFGAARVECTGTTSIELLRDGAVVFTKSVTGDASFRLPSIAPSDRWSVRLTGTATVRQVSLAASFAELQQV